MKVLVLLASLMLALLLLAALTNSPAESQREGDPAGDQTWPLMPEGAGGAEVPPPAPARHSEPPSRLDRMDWHRTP